MSVRRVIPLTLGWEELPKTVSVLGADPAIRLREPVPGVLLQIDDGWLLLDTGLNPALVRDPVLYQRFHSHGVEAELPPGDGDPLVEAVEQVGLAMEQVSVVALSHLHNDHAGGVRHFAGRDVPVHVQRRELDYGLHAPHPGPERNGIFRIDFDDPRLSWVIADGDVEIAPGVTAVLTAGHTPGHQSFVVDLAGGGGFVFAFDAADLQENIDDEVAVGGSIGVPPEATLEPLLRLKAIAAEKGYRLIPGHDPHVWPALTAELG
ncbi:MAG: N-acyl homoserine lactone hydrolase [Frankiaceae bacterium]|jgi:glyoxylase-like metal-dependent hydrolase (beta-lactamase superfamily II)|nr:N-acyl homoserine lactone hydrolase [Frankiaceae bacterium]